jgi:hypothetical protein
VYEEEEAIGARIAVGERGGQRSGVRDQGLEVCWGENIGMRGGGIIAAEGDEFDEFVGLGHGKMRGCFFLMEK